jgi:hypothetical protein
VEQEAMAVTDDENPSVLAGLQPFEWSNERSVAYEVAIEIIGQAMAYYTGLVEQERQGENRPERIRELEAARAAAAIQRDELDVFDAAEVVRVRDEYAVLVRRLRQELLG